MTVSDPTDRTILHVDMDAFYASVEQRDNPELRGKPVIVGGPSKRGVVCAASYEARPFGVRSAMPMAEALRRCPQAVVVSGRMSRYAEASSKIFQVFRRFTPLVEGLSLDEAFLDVTASRSLFGDGRQIAQALKDAIRAELQLTASAGVAPSKFVAKIASDLKKPDGLVVVAAPEVAEFLRPLPIERMWGIGQKTAPKVRAAGLRTFGDLQRAPRATLERVFGSGADDLVRLACGDDPRSVIPDREAKSVGGEETFEHDTTDMEFLRSVLLHQAERVAARMVSMNLVGRAISVKLKHSDFTIKSRAKTLRDAVSDTDSIYEAACELLLRFAIPAGGVRLAGLSVSQLEERDRQPQLFVDPELARRHRLESVRAEISDKYGDGHLTRAALLESKLRRRS